MADLPSSGFGDHSQSAQADFPLSQGRLPVETAGPVAGPAERTPEYLYSVRMRAAGPDGRHISGAERIVIEAGVPEVSSELLRRALDRGSVAEARVSVDRRPSTAIHRIPCLPVVQLSNSDEIRRQIDLALTTAGVSQEVFRWALRALTGGELPQGAAALVDRSGRQLQPDPRRGVRARHFDYSPAGRVAARSALERAGLGHFRTFEALALASKVAWSGVALEICWSDEPGYLTGYVASAQYGYLRVPDWKPRGAPGGRIFVLDPAISLEHCVERLEQEWALVEPPVRVLTELQ